MGTRVVAYGREATDALSAVIRAAQAGDVLAPVTVVVPSNVAGLAARRTLAADGGLANVGFVTPFGLAEQLGRARAAAEGLVPLTDPVLVAAIRTELADRPGFFAAVASHAATESALARRYAELSRARPATLAALDASGSPRARALAELFGRVRVRLAGYADEDVLAAHARAAVTEGDPGVLALGEVVVHLPQPTAPALADLVGAVAERRSGTWIVGLTGDASADAPVLAALARWGVEVPESELSAPVRPSPVTGTEIITASDVDDEVRATLRRLLELAEAGLALDRTAMLIPPVEPYARTVVAALDAAGIVHNGPPIRRLGDSLAGRTLTRLIGMVDSTFGRGEVIALLAAAPVLGAHGTVPVDRWDVVSRRAGVVDGDHWGERLERYAAELDARMAARVAEDDPGDPAPSSVARSARELAAFVAELRERVARFAASTGWRDRATAAAGTLCELLGDEHQRARWPEEEQDAFAAVAAALDRLAALEAVEPAPAAGAFARAVESELAAPAGRVGRYGEGVLVAPIATGLGLDLDAVFVLGLAEGLLPAPRREDALLADADRGLAVDEELAGRDRALEDQRRAYLAALAASPRHRVLSMPRGDLRSGRERLPSRFLLETASALADRRVFGSELSELGIDDGVDAVPSFAAGIARVAYAASPADRVLGLTDRFARAGGDAAEHPLVAGTMVATGMEAVRGRASASVTRWDGNVGSVRDQVRSPATGDVVSPTRLEHWATCPLRYLLANVLRVPAEETPERLLELSPLDRGTLVHEVLEQFVRNELERPEAERTPVGQPWPADALERMLRIMGEVAADAEAKGLTGKATLWRLHREEIATDLAAFIEVDDWYRTEESLVPVAVELPFGLDGRDPVPVELADGRVVQFRGRADRVDVDPAGTYVVLDYKTGRVPPTDPDLEADPVRAGTRLQLPVYAAAARQRWGADQVEAAYWYVTGRGGFVRDRMVLDDAVEARFREAVGHIVEGIDAGCFPSVPGEADPFFGSSANCRYCAYDALCPADRYAQYDAKAGAPEYAAVDALWPEVTDHPGVDQ